MKSIYASLRERWTPGRVIVALTTLLAMVAPPIAAFAATWVATHFPGLPPIDPDWLAGIFVTSVIATITPIVVLGFKRLDGQMQYERLVADPHSLTEEKVLRAKAPPTGRVLDAQLTSPEIAGDPAFILSDDGDIAESDVDDPDALARREREQLEGPQ